MPTRPTFRKEFIEEFAVFQTFGNEHAQELIDAINKIINVAVESAYADWNEEELRAYFVLGDDTSGGGLYIAETDALEEMFFPLQGIISTTAENIAVDDDPQQSVKAIADMLRGAADELEASVSRILES